MRNLWIILVVMLAAAPLLMTGCQTFSSSNEAQAQPISDQQLTDDVLQRLHDDTVTGQTTFNVQVKDGVATIRGVVGMESVKGRAIGVARGTPGVVDVIDSIQLR